MTSKVLTFSFLELITLHKIIALVIINILTQVHTIIIEISLAIKSIMITIPDYMVVIIVIVYLIQLTFKHCLFQFQIIDHEDKHC